MHKIIVVVENLLEIMEFTKWGIYIYIGYITKKHEFIGPINEIQIRLH
jgi:hypothetical protein